MWNVVTVSLRQAIVPDHVHGRLNSSYRLHGGTMPAGAAIAGLGPELLGPRGVFAVFAVASILLLVPILTVTDARIEATKAESKRS